MEILIVEDDPIWQIKIATMLEHIDDVSIVFVDSVCSTILRLEVSVPDLIIADIVLHKNTSFSALKGCEDLPIIFVTSCTDITYLKESLEFPKAAFLIKPFHQLSLLGSINRLLYSKPIENGIWVVGNRGKRVFLDWGNIKYLKAEGNYTIIYADGQKYVIKKSLRKIKKDLSSTFIQVQKAFVINSKYISPVHPKDNELVIDGMSIPIGRIYKENVKNLISFNHF